MTETHLPAISLFSGALGLDLGIEASGFQVRVAVEFNKYAAETIRRNRPDITVIEKPIEKVSTDEILEAAGLRVGEAALVTGGPSCQAFSTAGKRGSMSDEHGRGTLFQHFLRIVGEAQPRFFVMENVKGVFSSAVRHRPLSKRGPGHPPLTPEEEMGSGFQLILEELIASRYYTVFDLLNSADFGVPQRRERVVFIGSRDGERVRIPTPTHAGKLEPDREPWVTLRDALHDLPGQHTYNSLPLGWQGYMRLISEGQNWRNLPEEVQAEALGAAYKSWGGRSGFFRRLSWDAPAPSITTDPMSKATMLGHPSELRSLSVEECARLQQFPDTWEFAGGIPQQYIQIGNAVPVGLGKALGDSIRATMRRGERVVGDVQKVICADPGLLNRLAKRPTTVLNPDRMREEKGVAAAKEWRRQSTMYRASLLDFVGLEDEQDRQPSLFGRDATRREQPSEALVAHD